MYIKIDDTKYAARNVSQSNPIGTWFKINIIGAVELPEEITGVLPVCSDSDFELCTINTEEYARHTYVGGVLTFTNEPEPEPVPEPEPDPVVVKSNLLQSIDKTCDERIEAGIDITFSEDNTEHFGLSTKDQIYLSNLFKVVELGGTQYLYQDGSGNCRVYSAEEIIKIYTTTQSYITYHTTYRNELKRYVATLETVDELNTVVYGMELPEEYATEMNGKLAVAQSQMDLILANVAKLQAASTGSTEDTGSEESTATEEPTGTVNEAADSGTTEENTAEETVSE